MNKQGTTAKLPSVRTDESNRSQNAFIAGGLAIVIGGLWLLYDVEGPYHPDTPMTEAYIDETSDG